jgi:RNA polymerase sigma-70 factor (ECF subfamily)
MMRNDDQYLCERAAGGESAAAGELVSRHYQRIFAYLRRLCANDSDAEDLTQKTFGKAWTALTTYQARSSVSTWLHGIAYHVYVDWRRRVRPTDARSDEWWEARAAQQPTPYESAAQQESARQLFRWVDQLDDEKRQVVHLHYYQELSLSETAEALGIATSTVKYRLREALDFLRSKTAEPAIAPIHRRTV